MATRATRTTDHQSESQGSNLVRLSVNLNDDTANALRKLAEERGVSVTEAVRRAISLYNYLEDEVRSGRHVQTADSARKEVRELILL